MRTYTVCVGVAVEYSLHNSVRAILREMGSQSTSHKGMLRWTLHKKVETHPSNSVSLIKVLVKALEKAGRTDCKMHVIPLLHTLSYVAIQSGPIPDSLYRRVCECFRTLLTLPQPYSAVTLRYLRNMKMEMTTPGALYLRRLVAEQNIKNEHFTLQEKVFVLVDPAVFSGPLAAAVRADLEMATPHKGTLTHERTALLHTLQTGLGGACRSPVLVQALEALEEYEVHRYVQEVVLAVEHGVKQGVSGYNEYQDRLQHIYRDILTAAGGVTDQVDRGSLFRAPLPTPEMNFLLWNNEEELWNALVNFALGSCPNPGTDEEEEDKRDSGQAVDGGIEEELKDHDSAPDRSAQTALTRRLAFKNTKPADKLTLMREKMDACASGAALLREERGRTARVVVMGDDRALGRLAKGYHGIRERESKRLILTKKLNLQLYYVPVTDDEPVLSSPVDGKLSLASLLGRADPWYNSNVNSLGAVIPKLAETHSKHNKQNVFLLDVLTYYLRCGTQPVNLPLYSVKITSSTCDAHTLEEVFVSHLHVDFPEFRHLKGELLEKSSVYRKRKTVKKQPFLGAVFSVSYKKISLSKREAERGMAPTTRGVVIRTVLPIETAGQDYLAVSFDSINPRCSTEIQTRNISITTLEERRFTVCLDKDSRRTYNNVQRIEISPCLDPGYTIQSADRSKFSVRDEKEATLSRYLNKVLSLPVNTFTGITP